MKRERPWSGCVRAPDADNEIPRARRRRLRWERERILRKQLRRLRAWGPDERGFEDDGGGRRND